ncbi:hypothetical protein DFH28DRAFT_1111982 [Melampsora americana]|nr:hypothetical protein DFH28DRAFT_1111982 [Melampsora americana]
MKSVESLLRRMKDMKNLHLESSSKLNQLLQDPNYTINYIKDQWSRQRECQLKVICTNSIQALTDKLAHLVDLEENLQQSQLELRDLRRKCRRTRNQADERRMLRLPDTLTIIEEEIDSVIDELGAEEFRSIPGAGSQEGRAMIQLRVSKGRLYEAKFGVLEAKKQANERSGTRHLQRHLKLLRSKEAELRKKYVTFERQASAYNASFPNQTPINFPDFEQVKSTPIEDQFWDFGRLTHPEEAWATNSTLQDGIKWYLEVTHSEDELRRIGRECRQSIRWAVETYKKLMDLKEIIFSRNDSLGNEHNEWLMELVTPERPDRPHCKHVLIESREVLISLFSNEIQTHSCLLMTWNRGMASVMSGTLDCTNLPIEDEALLKTKWNKLVDQVKHMWGGIVLTTSSDSRRRGGRGDGIQRR